MAAKLLEINVDGTDARRFYERHGCLNSERGEDQSLLYYYQELGDASWREQHRDVAQSDLLPGVRIRCAQLLLAIRDQLRDALLVGAVGGEGDEFLFGVVGELEHDVL